MDWYDIYDQYSDDEIVYLGDPEEDYPYGALDCE